MNKENQIILYQDDNEITRVSVRFADEDLWLTQGQLVEIYQTSKSNVSEHIKHIFEDGELAKEATVRKFRTVQIEGSRKVEREVEHYNLDMIIALGYRVQSQVATRFRRWATQRLHEYIQKGFAMDDERLKQGGNRYFRELLQRIRDIRSSESITASRTASTCSAAMKTMRQRHMPCLTANTTTISATVWASALPDMKATTTTVPAAMKSSRRFWLL